MKSKTITVKLPLELDRHLERLASRLNKTKSLLVRLAIEELLRQPEAESKLSAFEALSGYAGILTGLPANLAEASKQLKGYGE